LIEVSVRGSNAAGFAIKTGVWMCEHGIKSITARQRLSLTAREPVMKNTYSIDEQRIIAERSEMIVRGLTLGIVSDNEATKTLRAVRLCATGANSTSSKVPVSSARQEVALASLDLIVALKNSGPRDQRIGRAMNALEAWKLELATP
jgi:hypothetical protein